MSVSDGDSGAGCAVKAGFFLLRRCGAPARATCTACQRPVCGPHTVQVEGQPYCTECAASQSMAAGSARPSQFKGTHYDYSRSQDSSDALFWAFQFRHHYYDTYDTFDTPWLSDFDDNDAAAFANAADVDPSDDDEAATDLFDS
jgi:hypothetical protein